jgi:cytochrome b561
MKPASRYHPLLVALHWLLAALILAALAVGFFGLAAMPNADPQKIAGLPEIVFAESGAPLPMSFAVYPTFQAHFWLAVLLVVVIVLHVGAALYHQLVHMDGLLARMSFGRRGP